jgi:hypothetical protein
MQVQVWADGRITGKHPAAARAFGALSARYKNVVADASLWTGTTGATITPGGGVVGPDGGPSDLIESDTLPVNVIIKPDGVDGRTWATAAGGRFVFCVWIRSTNPTDLFGSVAVINSASFTPMSFGTGFCGTGWQLVTGHVVIGAVGSATPSYTVYLTLAAHASVSVRAATAFYVHPDVDDNDFFEMAGTLKPQPRYLMPGMVGTMEDQILVAHKGIGSVIETVTLGSANGNSIKAYDEAGNFIGYIELKDAAP